MPNAIQRNKDRHAGHHRPAAIKDSLLSKASSPPKPIRRTRILIATANLGKQFPQPKPALQGKSAINNLSQRPNNWKVRKIG
ncbi:MAG TPA: hypothetical protein VMV10_18755 [Pirellulales bacterium]|nr:hypothetical protein [Pirellulales bacterium]